VRIIQHIPMLQGGVIDVWHQFPSKTV
jgi:hypothetical protein